MGSISAHWLLGAENGPPPADWCAVSGVLGGEDGAGALALRTDRDRQQRLGGRDSVAPRWPGAGILPVESAHLQL